MTVQTYSTTIHTLEDTDKSFSIADVLAQAGFTGTIATATVANNDLIWQYAPTAFALTPSNRPDWSGSESEQILVTDTQGHQIYLNLCVVVDPCPPPPP